MAQNLVVLGIVSLFKVLHRFLVLVSYLIPNPKIREGLGFALGVPFYMFWITVDRVLFPAGKRFNPFVQFPRNTVEVVQRGELLFELVKEYMHSEERLARERSYSTVNGETDGFSPLKAPTSIPKNAKFISLKRSGETDDFIKESLKTIQVSFFDVKFSVPGEKEPRQVTLFVKIPGGRTIAKTMLAVTSAALPRAMEQRFYEDAFPHIDPALINIPHVYASFSSRMFQHSCGVAEKVDTSEWKSFADAGGMSLPQAQALAKVSARLHGQFWEPPVDWKKDKRLNMGWEKRQGLDWISWMVFFFSDKEKDFWRCPPWVPSLWATLVEFYKPAMMCFSHADCRPGNMLFSAEKCPSSKQSDPCSSSSVGEKTQSQVDEIVPSTEVAMTDWEASNITVSSWDFSYGLLCGFPPVKRRKHMRYLFELHWQSLVETLQAHDSEAAKTLLAEDIRAVPSLAKRFEHDITSSSSSSCRHRPITTVKDRIELETDIVPVLVFYFGWLIAHTGNVGETQGNNESDGSAWSERMRGFILDSFLCAGDDKYCICCADGSAAFNKTWRVGGCACEDKTTMEELGILHPSKGNVLQPRSDDDFEPLVEVNGAKLSKFEPPYHKMHLNGRILHFLEPYHKLGRECGETMKGAAKSNPKKYNRTLREDLLDMIQYCSEGGREEAMKDKGVASIWKKYGENPAKKKSSASEKKKSE